MDGMTLDNFNDIGALILFEDSCDFLPAEYIGDESKRKEVMAVLFNLPMQYRIILLARYFWGLDPSEVANVLDISRMKANKTLIKAELMLKGLLEEMTGANLSFTAYPEEGATLSRLFDADAENMLTPGRLGRMKLFSSGDRACIG